MRVAAWPLTALLLLGACTATAPAPPPPPPMVDLPASAPEVRAKVIRLLEARGFTIRSESDTDLEAVLDNHPPLGYAKCPTVWTRPPDSDSSQRRRATPLARATMVRVQIVPTEGGTRVVIVASHAEQQRNTLANQLFTVGCKTTGVLERELAEALRG